MIITLLHRNSKTGTLARIFLAAIFSFMLFSVDAQKKGFILRNVKKGETFKSIAAAYNISGRFLADYNNLEYYEGSLTAKTLRIPKETIAKKITNAQATVQDTTQHKDSAIADTSATAPVVTAFIKDSTTIVPYYAETITDSASVKQTIDTKKNISKLKKNLPVLIYLSASLILLLVAIVYYRYVNRK